MAELDPKPTITGDETNFPGGVTTRGRPVPTDEEIQAAIAKGVATVDTLKELGLVAGVTEVTGKSEAIVTGLAAVTKVIASLAAVSENAAIIEAKLNAGAGKIDLRVLKPDGKTESGTKVAVHWIAVA